MSDPLLPIVIRDIRALFYVPESRPGMFEMGGQGGGGEVGVSLYCRKVLIKSKAENIVPKWMRFAKGIVDSEVRPLFLSGEMKQKKPREKHTGFFCPERKRGLLFLLLGYPVKLEPRTAPRFRSDPQTADGRDQQIFAVHAGVK